MTETDRNFTQIKNAILKNKEKGTVEKSGSALTISFSGLMYSVTSDKEESVTFKAFDLDFAIKSAGEILMIELENKEVKFYEIEEGRLRDSLLEFLSWRSKAVETVGI